VTPVAPSVPVEDEDDIYVDPNTAPLTPPPPAITPIVAVAAPEGSTPPSAIYYKNPTRELIEQSKHVSKSTFGVLFIQKSKTFRGKFTLGKNVNAAHILSGDKIDLSMADFIYPVTKIVVSAILGGVEVIVPRGVRVQANGLGILGGFEGTKSGQNLDIGQDAPLIVVKGVAILGGVDVKVNQDVPPIRIVY